MSPIPLLVGMVHLLPLPGSPGFRGSIQEVLEASASEAVALGDAGFPALLVENFGDAPFWADRVDHETVAAMTLAVQSVSEAAGLPVGVSVLRNDALAALAVAAVTTPSSSALRSNSTAWPLRRSTRPAPRRSSKRHGSTAWSESGQSGRIRREEMTPVLKPARCSFPENRACSILRHRS